MKMEDKKEIIEKYIGKLKLIYEFYERFFFIKYLNYL